MNTLIPIITPFDENLQVDYNALNLLVEYLRDNHLLVNSWTGEVYSLSPKEYIDILSKVKNNANKKLTIYIPSYKYYLEELINKIKDFYGITEIDDNLMVELDTSDWLCNSDLCLSRTISKILNEITSSSVMLYVTGQYNVETIRGILRIYPEITHLVVDHSIPLLSLAQIINNLYDIDRRIELYIFGDYGFIIKDQLIQGIISPIGLVKILLKKKYNVDVNDILFLTRITSYSYSIIGAIKTAINIIEPAIKEYVRPPLPTEFPGIREYIESVLNYLLK